MVMCSATRQADQSVSEVWSAPRTPAPGADRSPCGGTQDPVAPDRPHLGAAAALVLTTAPAAGTTGDVAPCDEGDTATHEVGHWLGLFHTSRGGCTGPGGHVTDTPAEAAPALRCEADAGRDSCPQQPGTDPLGNSTDYTEDFCTDRFSAGQVARTSNAWEAYRQGRS